MRISIQDQKQLIRQHLKLYFDDFNFVFKDHTAGRDTFTLRTEWGVVEISLDYKTSGRHYFSKVYLSHFRVEQNVLEIGLPNHDFSARLRIGDYSLTSVFDSQAVLGYDSEKSPVQTLHQVKVFGQSIIDYMEQAGWAFAQQFSHLPNVLTEINRLELEGRLWRDILSGQADYFFRGLIISKLCSDPEFTRKVSYVDTVFFDPQYNLEEWLPHYRRLKEKLLTLEPLENQ